jgi:uncharacterized protein YacL
VIRSSFLIPFHPIFKSLILHLKVHVLSEYFMNLIIFIIIFYVFYFLGVTNYIMSLEVFLSYIYIYMEKKKKKKKRKEKKESGMEKKIIKI